LTPETTAGREGFIHPYVIEGGVGQVKVSILLRDFDTPKWARRRRFCAASPGCWLWNSHRPGWKWTTQPQYRNMADGLKKEPRALAFAGEAMRRAGFEPQFHSIRGGTDGSQLTARGLPTPNLSTGEHNPHSPLEWTCLEEMETACRILVELAQVWGAERG